MRWTVRAVSRDVPQCISSCACLPQVAWRPERKLQSSVHQAFRAGSRDPLWCLSSRACLQHMAWRTEHKLCTVCLGLLWAMPDGALLTSGRLGPPFRKKARLRASVIACACGSCHTEEHSWHGVARCAQDSANAVAGVWSLFCKSSLSNIVLWRRP